MEHQIEIDREKCLRCGSCVQTCSTGFLRMREGQPVPGGRIRCIGCGQCVSVCPAEAICLDGQGSVSAPGDSLEEIFLRRRSVRRFTDKLPEREIIRHALDVAQYAPSGKNRHANRWTVVYGPESCRRVSALALDCCRETGCSPELLALADKGIDLLTGHAPVVLIGWSPDDALNPCVDTVIAMHTVQMLLERQGLGCCWGGYLRDMTARSPALKALLGIPEGSSMQCCMMVGYPAPPEFCNIPPRPRAEAFWLAN